MAAIEKLIRGISTSAARGDTGAIQGACRGALLLLGEEEDPQAAARAGLQGLAAVLQTLPLAQAHWPLTLTRELALRAPGTAAASARGAITARAAEFDDAALTEAFFVALGRLLADHRPSERALRARIDQASDDPLRARLTQHEAARPLLQLLDAPRAAPLLVFHPGLERGWRLTMDGVTDLGQLSVLLADVLIGDSPARLPGRSPTGPAVRACRGGLVPTRPEDFEGRWNLLSWRALQPDGQLDDDMEHWLWNEQGPADIPRFEDIPVLLLADPPYRRSWPAARRFEERRASVSVTRTLDQADVRDWLQRLASPSPASGG